MKDRMSHILQNFAQRQNDPAVNPAGSKIIVNLPLSAHVFYSQQVQREVSIKPNKDYWAKEKDKGEVCFPPHDVAGIPCATL